MTDRVGRPRITVFTLGGTIASTHADQSSQGVSPRLSAAELVAAVPQLSGVADIEAVTFRQLPSGDLDLADLIELAGAIKESFLSGVTGVVVTQGTDTIEETSFALDLLVRDHGPVVVTGAMRNPTMASADGPANLLSAVRVAASPGARGLGALVVMNDEIHAARFVRKTHTSNLASFRSPSSGPLGWIIEDRPHIVVRVGPLESIKSPTGNLVPPVALITCAVGDDARIIEKLESLGYGGAIIQGFGGGHVPSRIVAALEVLAEGVPVILASRTGGGELLQATYGFPGSERDLLARGLISAGSLDGLKARILLSLVLSAYGDNTQSRLAFERVVASIPAV